LTDFVVFFDYTIYYTFEAEKGPYLTENQSQIKNPTYQTKYRESKSVSYAPKIDFKAVETSEQYNLPLNQEKGPNDQNFITLSKISEEERVEIIKLGFQLNQQGKISLKKYYETTQEYSLFQVNEVNRILHQIRGYSKKQIVSNFERIKTTDTLTGYFARINFAIIKELIRFTIRFTFLQQELEKYPP
jgi:hypothetical protein